MGDSAAPTPALPFEPDRDGLGKWLRERVDDDMLHRISKADHGYKAELVYGQLKRFVQSGVYPDRLSEVRECCELCSNGRDPVLVGMLSGFVLATYADFWQFDAVWSRLGRVVLGAMLSGKDCSLHAVRFLCWLSQSAPPYVPIAHLYMAVLLLDARWELGGKRGLREQAETVCRVADNALEAERELGIDDDPGRWIFGLDHYGSDDLWREMARQVMESPSADRVPEVRAFCQRIISLAK